MFSVSELGRQSVVSTFPPFTRQVDQTDKVQITFDVALEHIPALNAAVDEIRDLVGTRLEGPHKFSKEAALTRASIGLGALAAALNSASNTVDPNFR